MIAHLTYILKLAGELLLVIVIINFIIYLFDDNDTEL